MPLDAAGQVRHGGDRLIRRDIDRSAAVLYDTYHAASRPARASSAPSALGLTHAACRGDFFGVGVFRCRERMIDISHRPGRVSLTPRRAGHIAASPMPPARFNAWKTIREKAIIYHDAAALLDFSRYRYMLLMIRASIESWYFTSASQPTRRLRGALL